MYTAFSSTYRVDLQIALEYTHSINKEMTTPAFIDSVNIAYSLVVSSLHDDGLKVRKTPMI